METTTTPGISGQFQKTFAGKGMTKFDKLKGKLEKRPGITDRAGLASYLGRKSLGTKEFNRRAVLSRKKK
jgi:hypothetical protein